MQRLAHLIRRRQGLPAWLIAAAVVVGGLAARYAFDSWVAQVPLLPFFPLLMAIALLCGWRQGMISLFLFAAAAWLIFLPHRPTPYGMWRSPTVAVAGFLAIGTFMVLLVALLGDLIFRLEASKRIQESLFQELQHRVANNMQFISSMLLQERRRINDGAAAEVLDQAASRIAAMARLNRRLSDPATYESGLEPIVRDLLNNVFDGLPVEVKIDIPEVRLPIDQMTAIVLLVSEAATNAVKHVFQAKIGGLFEVSLSALGSERLKLMVRDDGPGLGLTSTSEPGLPVQGLGLRIMQGLAYQLGGPLEFRAEKGTTLVVEFVGISNH